MNIINTVIGTPLGALLRLCYEWIGNYGLAILFFTLLTKVVLLPLAVWGQKNSINMIKIKPALNMAEVNCAGDRNKLAEEQLALYKSGDYKPWLGMLPLLVQVVVIIGLISVVYHPLQHILRLDQTVITAFVDEAMHILGVEELGSGAHLRVVELVNDPAYTARFASLNVPGAAAAIEKIQALDMSFLGLDLSATPDLKHFDVRWLIPLLSGLSAFFLCWVQNRINVLQKEASWLGRWGMTIFLTAFSLYFATIVPLGVGVYWIGGNLFAVLTLVVVNAIMPPKRYIDYEALEASKIALAQARAHAKATGPTREEKARGKADYKRFSAIEGKRLVFYAERGGYYKYFSDMIDYVLEHSDITVHYITSDPRDPVLGRETPQFRAYYIDDNRLVVLFMQMDADMVVMTTPDLQQMYLKRSYVRKDVEYVYAQHAQIVGLRTVRRGALDHYDTVFCPSEREVDIIRKDEQANDLKAKNLVVVGYPLLDTMRAAYRALPAPAPDAPKRILIAPSYQDGNILESCLTQLLDAFDGAYDVTVRPHPQYARRFPARYAQIKNACQKYAGDRFRFEDDFGSSSTVFESDMVITDWSSISFEFAFATEKPVLFIDTPLKVINEAQQTQEDTESPEFQLRNVVGRSIRMEDVSASAAEVAADLFRRQDECRRIIGETAHAFVAHLGEGKRFAGGYIVDRLQEKQQRKGMQK